MEEYQCRDVCPGIGLKTNIVLIKEDICHFRQRPEQLKSFQRLRNRIFMLRMIERKEQVFK